MVEKERDRERQRAKGKSARVRLVVERERQRVIVEVEEVDHERVTRSVGVDNILLRCSEQERERLRERD